MRNAREFKFHVLHHFLTDVHRFEPDNYSYERFSYDGVDRSTEFDVGKRAEYLEWFMLNATRLFEAYLKLADQASRDLYVDLLRYRLAGHLHVRIRSRAAQLKDEAQRFASVFAGTPSSLPTTGLFGNLVHYDNEWNGTSYTVDTVKGGLLYSLVYRQYAFERDGVVIRVKEGDHVIDGGAFTGDSAIVFSRATGVNGRVYAFDPVQNHIDICRMNFARPGFENIRLFECGLSDRNVDAPPVRLDAYHPGWRPGSPDAAVPMRRIDDLVDEGSVERIDFIKLDVEGSELAALRAAVASMRRFRPRLAISIYHRPDDFYQICSYIDGLGIGYRFYLDHYTIWDEETVLYAVVPA